MASGIRPAIPPKGAMISYATVAHVAHLRALDLGAAIRRPIIPGTGPVVFKSLKILSVVLSILASITGIVYRSLGVLAPSVSAVIVIRVVCSN